MAQEIGSTRESLGYNPGRETVHADPKTGEPEVFLEPLLWGLFSLGGFITAFLFPITVFLLFLAPVFGLWPTDPAAYLTFAAHWREPLVPTSCPGSARETTACSICNVSTVCSRFVDGPWICTVSPIAIPSSVRRIAATPIFP